MKRVVIICVLSIIVCLSYVFNVGAEMVTSKESIMEGDVTTKEFVDELIKKQKVIEMQDNSLNTITIDNKDGTNTMYLFNENVRYIDEQGVIRNKEISLTQSTDKLRINEGYIFEVKANDIESYYPINLKNKGIIVGNIEIIPCDSNAVLHDTNEYCAIYEDVFSGVDCKFIPEYEGISIEINLDSIQKIKNVVFSVRDKGEGEIKSYSQDQLIIEDEFHTYEITGQHIVDSEGNDVGITTVSLNSDNTLNLNYELNSDVSNEESVTTGISISVQNRYIFSTTLFEDTVYVNDGYNYIGTKIGYGMARTFIKFDLSAVQGIPYDSILSAYCYLVADKDNNTGCAEVYLVASEWDEYLDNVGYMPQIDYDNKLFSLNMEESAENYSTGVKKIYITSAIQAWLQGYANNGIMIKSKDDVNWMRFCSAKNQNAPMYLSITYSNNTDVPKTKGIEYGGQYYILNKKTRNALAIKSTIPPSDAYPEVFTVNSYPTDIYEEWHIMYDSTENGIEYFRLRENTSSSFLEAFIDGQSGYVKTSIVSSSDGQRWRIVRNWNGSYKFIPKNSNGQLALCIEKDENQCNKISLIPASIDSEYNDDWMVVPVNKENASLYGTCSICSNLDFRNEVNLIKNNLIKCGYNCFDYHTCDITTSDSNKELAEIYLENMFKSNIWYSSAHGINSRIQFFEYFPNSSLPIKESRIGVQDAIEYDEEMAYAPINVYGIADYDGNLNKLQLAYMNSCLIGANESDENLIGTMYEEGAHCVIAHTESLDNGSSEKWHEYFNLALETSNVKAAIKFADRMYEAKDNLSRHILGDTSIFYNYEANSEDVSELSIVNYQEDDVFYNNNNEMIANVKEINEMADFNELFYEYDNNGGIHGYSKYLYDTLESKIQLMYSYYDKNNEFGNKEITNITGALVKARKFVVEDMNIVINSDFNNAHTTNTYSNEFICKWTKNNPEKGGIKSITVYVEENEMGEQIVTFYKAEY